MPLAALARADLTPERRVLTPSPATLAHASSQHPAARRHTPRSGHDILLFVRRPPEPARRGPFCRRRTVGPAPARTDRGSVLRAKQGAIRFLRLPGHEDPPLRHPLLQRGCSRHRGRRPHVRALVRAAGPHLPARVRAAQAGHPVRRPSRLPADQHSLGVHQRGHRRCHRVAQEPRHHAAGGHLSRHRPRARTRAGARLPVQHRPVADRRRIARHGPVAALGGGGDGGIPLGRQRRPSHGHVAARRPSARRCADARTDDPRTALLPVPLRPGLLDIRWRHLRR